MRKVKLVVGNNKIGHALTWAYPEGDVSIRTYLIPTYHLTVSGIDSVGKRKERKFEVIRFGVQQKSLTSPARVVGLANHQTHHIKKWIPTYQVHSSHSPENGAWQVYDNFLIHDGPDNPMGKRNIFASIGCIEVCGGPQGFVGFNDYIIELSGPKASKRSDQLIEIGKSRNMDITYLAAARPKLTIN